jgi:ribose-phosphate pyrophosphokinase
MRPLLFAFPGNEAAAPALLAALAAEAGELELSRFADGESRVRLGTDVTHRDVVLFATLRDPDPQIPGLLFAADAAREHGAGRVLLAAPYLAYMRQDKRFRPGEAVSARSFGKLLSRAFDGLVTVDPHLHRIHDLAEIYTIPALALRAAPLLAAWIRDELERPVVVGPDSESRQWAAEVGSAAGCPHAVLSKLRHDDRTVEIDARGLEEHAGLTPVIVDDIIATAGTTCEAVKQLREAGFGEPVVLAVHGLFADGAEDRLRFAGASRVVTTDSIPHESNAIALAPLLAQGLRELLDRD